MPARGGRGKNSGRFWEVREDSRVAFFMVDTELKRVNSVCHTFFHKR